MSPFCGKLHELVPSSLACWLCQEFCPAALTPAPLAKDVRCMAD